MSIFLIPYIKIDFLILFFYYYFLFIYYYYFFCKIYLFIIIIIFLIIIIIIFKNYYYYYLFFCIKEGLRNLFLAAGDVNDAKVVSVKNFNNTHSRSDSTYGYGKTN